MFVFVYEFSHVFMIMFHCAIPFHYLYHLSYLVIPEVSAESIYILDNDESRGAFVHVSSEADQERAIDALNPLDISTASDEARQLAERLVIPGQSAVVSVITPITVAEAMRTISFR